MVLFKKKQEANLDDICRDFYEKNILNPMIGGIDIRTAFPDTVKHSIVEADHNFTNISSQKFAGELVILHFELFALAWQHQFGVEIAVAQSTFTRHYLHEKKRDDIWGDSESYNKAIARSSTLSAVKEKKASDIAFVARVNKTMFDLFKEYFKKGYDPDCIARAVNRIFSDKAWKQGTTAGLLMFALCDRLGFDKDFEPSKEAQFRITAVIHGLYDGALQSLANLKIKK